MHSVKLDRKFPWGEQIIVKTDDICSFLVDRFGARFPSGGRILKGMKDVTPRTEEDVEALEKMSGTFSVVVNPAGPAVAVLAVSTVLSIGIGLLLRPRIEEPTVAQPKDVTGSPTNVPGKLPNTPRINNRVPDCYGLIRMTPDLLSPVRRVYEEGVLTEYAYLCIGRGKFSDFVMDIYDGDMLLEDISGYSAKVFLPGDRISESPQHLIGEDFSYFSVLWKPIENSSIDSLPPLNLTTMAPGETAASNSALYPIGTGSVGDEYPHVWSSFGVDGPTYNDAYNLGYHYWPGATIRISNLRWSSSYSGGPYTGPDITGDYKVLRSESNKMWLDIPDDKKAAWAALPTIGDTGPAAQNIRMDLVDVSTTLDFTARANSKVAATFEAPSGLYFADDGSNDPHAAVTQYLTLTTTWRQDGGATLPGTPVAKFLSGSSRTRVGITLEALNPHPDKTIPCTVDISVQRISPFKPGSPSNWAKNSQARIDLLDIWACTEPTEGSVETSPGVTTILTRLKDTQDAQQLRNRKISVVSHKVLEFDGVQANVSSFPWVLGDMITDEHVGRLAPENFDFDYINGDLYVDLALYFGGDPSVLDVGIVFDDENTSLEEMIAAVAQAVHCRAYRVGDVIKLRSDIPQEVPTLLFNVRNKVPNSEVRTIRFGYESDFDSTIVPYRDSSELYEQREFSAGSVDQATPLHYRVQGLVSEKAAAIHARRRWNRAKYEWTQISFDATEEAALLVPGDLILVTDGTRDKVVAEGDLIGITGVTTLQLDRSVNLEPETKDYWIYLQQTDGTVSIHKLQNVVTYDTNEVEVDVAPDTFSIDATNYSRTTYMIVEHTGTSQEWDARDPADSADSQKFIVTGIQPAGKMTYTVEAVRYDDRIYANDNDPVS